VHGEIEHCRRNSRNEDKLKKLSIIGEGLKLKKHV
jgi:hypothetical protein